MPSEQEIDKVMKQLCHKNMSRSFATEFATIFGADDKTINSYNREIQLSKKAQSLNSEDLIAPMHRSR